MKKMSVCLVWLGLSTFAFAAEFDCELKNEKLDLLGNMKKISDVHVKLNQSQMLIPEEGNIGLSVEIIKSVSPIA